MLTRSGVDFFFFTADWTFLTPGSATLTVFASFFECEEDAIDDGVAPSSRMLVVSDMSVEWFMFERSGDSESDLVFVPRRIALQDKLCNVSRFAQFLAKGLSKRTANRS